MDRLEICGNERGGVLAELAILVPLVILFTGAIIDFGKMIRESNVLVEASRHGARSGGALLNPGVNWCTQDVSALTIPCAPAPVQGAPLQTAAARSCDYIQSAGLSRNDWIITASRVVTSEDPVIPLPVIELKVDISQNPASKSRCVLCWVPALTNWLLSAESSFPAQIRCG